MGTDPAPFMANLFLYHYERKFMLELKSKNISEARKFNNVFRFIDDLGTINDSNLFEKHHKSIYPPEMELKKENDGYKEASLLDLDVKINSNKFQLKLFDKRDAFPFSIVRMPYLSNNMPSTIFYSTLCSELLRIATCTTEKASFICSAKTLLDRMISQGAQMHRLNKSLTRLYGNHMNTFLPFFEDSNQMIQSILHIK